ncbi:DUF4055 domain-containing protein [Serratia marcescens]|uniref:DUF4055 domain-containing protein n=1 Tax=Serratia marcescens TaxID=615 RepID=UPI0034E8C512
MTDDVRKRSAKIEAIAECWPMITALLGGTEEMREASTTYLPQWPNEDSGYYKKRLSTATLFPAFSRTVEVLSGKPFSRPITWSEDVPSRIQEFFEDIDLQGTNLHSFLADICEEAMAYGICGLLVDYPPAENIKTRADELASGVRPYWVKIAANSLLDYKSKRVNGREVFTQLRFLESVTDEDNSSEFSEVIVEQVRVIDIGRWRTYRQKKDEQTGETKWGLHEEGNTTLNKIPFVPFYGKRKGFMLSYPPLVELAYMNVEHWQSKSDQQTILHVARVPVLFGKNLGEGPITIGTASAITSDNVDSDLKYVEHSGKAIEAGRNDLLDLEDKMRQIGAELLVIKPGRVTVAQTMAEDEAGTCALQRIVQDMEDAVDQALQLTADWIKESKGGHVTIFNDFGASSLAEASASLLLDANIAGVVSNETLFAELQRRGYLKDGLKWDEESDRLKLQPPRQGAVKTTQTG